MPGVVSSVQISEKGTGIGSASLKHVDWVFLKKSGFIIRERMVKKGDRQILSYQTHAHMLKTIVNMHVLLS